MTTPDIALVFPPQWSPFQPPLSIPSLSAWLKRASYAVRSFDLNVRLYHWLLSEAGSQSACSAADETKPQVSAGAAYDLVRSHDTFRRAVLGMRGRSAAGEPSEFSLHAVGFRALETYCDAITELAGGAFKITPFGLRVGTGDRSASDLEQAVQSPHPLLSAYTRRCAAQVLSDRPRSVGISCIGEDQLFFTLLLGQQLKLLEPTLPIVVGGTVLPRIHERRGLDRSWFDRYFDIVIAHEGERPLEQFLSRLDEGPGAFPRIDGAILPVNGRVARTAACKPLLPDEPPDPDFDDLDLDLYLSPLPTLPILGSRGCYWGKCEFCHHGMVYGDRYGARTASSVAGTVERLAARYSVSHFAFNDEAIPPKLFRSLGQDLPSAEESGFRFTGLIKFERYYQNSDFEGAYRAGFRSLYVGLESASERVLRRMNKHTPLPDILRNLTDAAKAGIWMHCFVFFGFPGEQRREASETVSFVLDHADVIGSFGAGVFEFEHNAPIHRDPGAFGVRLSVTRSDDLSVYYDFEVEDGIDSDTAREFVRELDTRALEVPKYRIGQWIPREHLLAILDHCSPADLEERGSGMRSWAQPPADIPLGRVLHFDHEAGLLFNLMTGRVLRPRTKTIALLIALLNQGVTCGDARAAFAPEVIVELFGPEHSALGARPRDD